MKLITKKRVFELELTEDEAEKLYAAMMYFPTNPDTETFTDEMFDFRDNVREQLHDLKVKFPQRESTIKNY